MDSVALSTNNISESLNNYSLKEQLNSIDCNNLGDDTSTSQNDMLLSTPNFSKYSKSNIDMFGIIDKVILDDKKLVQFEYEYLEKITNKFSETFSEKPSGPVGKIGSGGFGDVYVGTHKTYGTLAVKRVRPLYQISYDLNSAMKRCNDEIKSLSHLRHENIVPIYGYNMNGPLLCIVCKYIDGGSLQQKIAAKVLTEQQRMYIMRGIAEGLKYIHHTEKPQSSCYIEPCEVVDFLSTKKSYYLHGNITSANILLTKDCAPKLYNFGQAKELDSTVITKSLVFAYMAPEVFHGSLTQKIDIFSFGIVLLELLTGLRPIIAVGGEELNINDYVKDVCSDGKIYKLVDSVVPKWPKAQKIYEIARHCLQSQKVDRPTIDVTYNALHST